MISGHLIAGGLAINLSSVPDLEYQDDQYVVLDVIDDAVITHTYTVCAVTTFQLDTTGWSRVIGEFGNSTYYAPSG